MFPHRLELLAQYAHLMLAASGPREPCFGEP
jgi:hypothetical protein